MEDIINEILEVHKYINEENYYNILYIGYSKKELDDYLNKNFEKVYLDENGMVSPYKTYNKVWVKKHNSNPSPLLKQKDIDKLLK